MIRMLSMLLVLSASCASAQGERGAKKVRSSLTIIEGYKFNDRTELSLPGAEYQITVSLTNALGLQLKGGVLRWDKKDLLSVPLLIGPEYSITRSDENTLAIYADVGPSLLVGNDYAGIFGTAESGLQYGAISQGLVIRVAWAQNLVFHPSHFSFLKFGIGWMF